MGDSVGCNGLVWDGCTERQIGESVGYHRHIGVGVRCHSWGRVYGAIDRFGEGVGSHRQVGVGVGCYRQV